MAKQTSFADEEKDRASTISELESYLGARRNPENEYADAKDDIQTAKSLQDQKTLSDLSQGLVSAVSKFGSVGGNTPDPDLTALKGFSESADKGIERIGGEQAEKRRTASQERRQALEQYLAEKKGQTSENIAERRHQETLGFDREKLAADKEMSGKKLAVEAEKNKNDAATIKPASADQFKAANFAKQADAADQIINGMKGKGYNAAAYQKSFAANMPFGLDTLAMSDADKSHNQAERDFISAVLRRESGAAISNSEYNNERLKYFPQPNDPEQVIEQKAASRRRKIEALKAEAGHAYAQIPNVDVVIPEIGGSGTASAAPAPSPVSTPQYGGDKSQSLVPKSNEKNEAGIKRVMAAHPGSTRDEVVAQLKADGKLPEEYK